jgi:hypothetical protein
MLLKFGFDSTRMGISVQIAIEKRIPVGQPRGLLYIHGCGHFLEAKIRFGSGIGVLVKTRG